MENIERRSKRYAWLVCILTCFIYICGIGFLSNGSFGPYLISDGGLTNTQNSLLVSIRSILSMIATATCAMFYKKISLRVGVSLGMIVGGIGWAFYAMAPNFGTYVCGAVLFGIVHGLAANVPAAMIVNNWFETKRNLVFGITTASSGFLSVILPPIVKYLVETFSLRTCFFVVCAVFLIVGVLTFIILRDRPADLGLHAYGYGMKDTGTKKNSSGAPIGTYAPSKLHFWILQLVYLNIGIQLYSTWSHVSVLHAASGFDSASFATLLSIAGFALMAGKIIFGQITDRTNAELTFYIFCPLQAVGCILNAYASDSQNFTLAVVACLLEGGAGVISTVGLSSVATELYKGSNAFTKAVVWFTTFYNVGHTISAPVFGMIADAVGTYSPAFYGAGVIGFINVILMAIVFRGSAKRAQRLKADGKEPIGVGVGFVSSLDGD